MYEIIIKKKETVNKTVNGDWKIIEKRPYTQKEYDDACNPFKSDPKELLKEIYGYTPPTVKSVEVETLLLHQFIENLDLRNVILSINIPIADAYIDK